MNEIQAVRGTFDIFPPQTYLWQFVEKNCRTLSENSGYLEIRTPIFEETALFERSIGETTEVVQKQMYSFTTPGGERITLRPEMTAPVIRAYLQDNLHKKGMFRKLYYIGPAFRYERPQAGRSRQFHQFGLEAIGSQTPLLDTETITIGWDILSECGIPDLTLRINSIGCRQCRPKYRELLAEELKPHLPALCEDCATRAEKNLFRVFDCKNEKCRHIVSKISSIESHLCDSCKKHFDKVKEMVSKHITNWNVDNHLVRGLDYYTNTVYEFTTTALGAQNSIGGGGRYDHLISDLGGPEIPAVGFALGLDRIILALSKTDADKAASLQPAVTIYLATISENEYSFAYELLVKLRRNSISADMDFEGRSLKAQLRQADKANSKFVVILGPDEIQNSLVKLKNLSNGSEEKIAIDSLSSYLIL
ncbi:MAG: histidine--tRNA ligase [Planctomycetota bacterium]